MEQRQSISWLTNSRLYGNQRSLPSIPQRHILFSFILILSSHQRVDLPTSFFPLGVQTKSLHIFILSPCMLHVQLNLLDFITVIFCEEYKLQSYLLLCLSKVQTFFIHELYVLMIR